MGLVYPRPPITGFLSLNETEAGKIHIFCHSPAHSTTQPPSSTFILPWGRCLGPPKSSSKHLLKSTDLKEQALIRREVGTMASTPLSCSESYWLLISSLRDLMIYLYFCPPGLCFYGCTCLSSPRRPRLRGFLHCTPPGHTHQGCHCWREVLPGQGPRRTHAEEPHHWPVITPDGCSQHIPLSWSPLSHPLGETTILTFSRIQHHC